MYAVEDFYIGSFFLAAVCSDVHVFSASKIKAKIIGC